MARRSDHTRDELKGLAIGKALEIIDEKGPEGFSARGLAGAMGYTVGTLYHVFGDLDSFMLHLNARILDDWHEELDGSLKKSRKEPLKVLAHGYVGFARKHNGRWRQLFEFRAATVAPGWYAEKMSRLFGMVETALAPHIKSPRKTRQAARVLWAGIHGICVLSLSGKLDVTGSAGPEALADDFIGTYLRGLE